MSTNVEVFDVSGHEATTDNAPDQVTAASQPQAASPSADEPIIDHANLIRTMLSIAVAGVMLVALTLLMAGVLAYKVLSSPPVVVVHSVRDRDGDHVAEHVVAMDGEMVGNVSARSKDRPGDGDKRAAADTWSTSVYQVDPASRADDLERAIKMMVPNAAVEFTKQIKPDLELQRRERWQSVWEPQVTSIDPLDPYTVRVVGKQHITKVVGGEVKKGARQLAFNLKVVFDSQKRAERNDRTGFLIADLRDFQIIADKPDKTEPTVEAPAQGATQPTPGMPQPGHFTVPQP